MKHRIFTLTGLLALGLAVPAARAGESPDGAWVVRLEAPFVTEQPLWMPLRIDLEIAGGKPVQAVASAIHFNLAWHPVDVTGLRLADGRLTGSLAVSFQADDNEKAAHGKDPFATRPAQVIAVDIPLGTITVQGRLGHMWEDCHPGVVLKYGPLVLASSSTYRGPATHTNGPSPAPDADLENVMIGGTAGSLPKGTETCCSRTGWGRTASCA